MAEVKLPLVGGVSRKGLAIGGAAAAGVVGLIWLRKRNSAASAAAAATGAGTSGDGSTGDYTDPGLQDTTQGPTYGQTGYYDPNTGQWVYGNTGTGQAAAITNEQWVQDAVSYMVENNAVADPGALLTALGLYIRGKIVTPAQESLIDQAIAAEGYPPQSGAGGYPPGIRTQPGGGQTVPPSPPTVKVPGGLVGGTAGNAHNKIVAAGLVPVADPGQKATWTVTSTTPASGHQVPKGTRVLITASAKKRK